jgi:hypothetical protein
LKKLENLKGTGFITPEEFKISKSSGLQPARIYGLPKIHKPVHPFRPILSVCGTYNYGLAIMLKERRKHLREHETVIRDTFSLIDALQKIRFRYVKSKMNIL